MSQIRYFVVTQERKVKVQAENLEDAVLIASAAFKNGQDDYMNPIDKPEGLNGTTTTLVQVTDIVVREDF